MKKIFANFIGFLAIVALILGCGENPDGSVNFLWTASCFTTSIVLILCYKRMTRNIEKSNL